MTDMHVGFRFIPACAGNTQSWTGANTFTSSAGLKITYANAAIYLTDTAIASPGGRYVWQSTLGVFRVIRNTALAGDFSTGTFPIIVNANDSVNFASTVSVGNAVAAGDAVNKGQLDSKVYGGQVNSAGTGVYMPSGWSSVRTSLGLYTITHNLGTTSYSVVANLLVNALTGREAHIQSLSANTFAVYTFNGATTEDLNFNFVVVRN